MKTGVHTNTFTQMFKNPYLNSEKTEVVQMSTDRSIYKIWHTHKADYYSAVGRSGVLIDTIQMYPENIRLSEKSQAQNINIYC